eukprot:354196-Chlamydomonas_euryale.AAC.20
MLLVARCMLALLIRSMTSTDAGACVLALGVAPPRPTPATGGAEAAAAVSARLARCAERWRGLAPRVLAACCRMVVCPGGDALVDTASVRVLGIVTDARHWKFGGAGGSGAAAHAAYSHLLSLAGAPAPLFAALERVMRAADCSGGGGGCGGSATGASPQRAAAPGPAALLPKLQPLVAAVMAQGVAGPAACGGSGGLVDAFARTLLLTPGAVGRLTEDVKECMRGPALAAELSRVMPRICAERRAPETGSSGSGGGGSEAQRGGRCLLGLANLTLLLVGPYSVTALPHGRDVRLLREPRPHSLRDGAAARAYATAVADLLPRAARLLRSAGHARPPAAAHASEAARSSSTRLAAGQTSAAEHAAGAARAGAAPPGLEPAASACADLWPLGQRELLLQVRLRYRRGVLQCRAAPPPPNPHTPTQACATKWTSSSVCPLVPGQARTALAATAAAAQLQSGTSCAPACPCVLPNEPGCSRPRRTPPPRPSFVPCCPSHTCSQNAPLTPSLVRAPAAVGEPGGRGGRRGAVGGRVQRRSVGAVRAVVAAAALRAAAGRAQRARVCADAAAAPVGMGGSDARPAADCAARRHTRPRHRQPRARLPRHAGGQGPGARALLQVLGRVHGRREERVHGRREER